MRYAVGRWDEARWDREPNREFAVGGQGAATSAAADEFLANLWNPHASRSLWVGQIFYNYSAWGGTPQVQLVHTSTRGTPGSTVTPDLDNDLEREITPDTGAVLDLANFSVEPTIASPPLYALAAAGTSAQDSSIQWDFPGRGLRVPPGTGLGLVNRGSVASATRNAIDFRFTE